MKLPCFLLVFTLGFTQAQNKCGVIVDQHTRQPVPYATVVTRPFASGTYSSDRGTFCLGVPTTTDSVAVSCLGYQPRLLSRSDFMAHDTLWLVPVATQLREVVVKAPRERKPPLREVGFADQAFKKRNFGHSESVNSGISIATFLPNPQDLNGTLSQLKYLLRMRGSKHTEVPLRYRIRLRALAATPGGLPGRDLLPEQLVIDVTDTQKEIVQPVAQYGIVFPSEGLWVGMECVGYVSRDSVYHELKTYEFGKHDLKNRRSTKKLKIARSYPVAPMVPMTKSSTSYSAYSAWGGKWEPHRGWGLEGDAFGTFSFGATGELRED